MALSLRPLGNRIVVRRSEEIEKVGGIIIPDSAKQKTTEGDVLAVGEGRLTEHGTLMPMLLKPGDRVLFGKYGGSEFVLGGETLLIMQADEVFGVLHDPGDGNAAHIDGRHEHAHLHSAAFRADAFFDLPKSAA